MKRQFYQVSLAGLLGVGLAASTAVASPPLITDHAGGTSYALRYSALELYDNASEGALVDGLELYYKTGAALSTGNTVTINASPISDAPIGNATANATIHPGDQNGLNFVMAKVSDLTATRGNASASSGPLHTPTPVAMSTSNPCNSESFPSADTYVIIGESGINDTPSKTTMNIYDIGLFCLRNNLGAVNSNFDAHQPVNTPVDNASHFGQIQLAGQGVDKYLSFGQGVVDVTLTPMNGVMNKITSEKMHFQINAGLDPACDRPKDMYLLITSNNEQSTITDVVSIVPQVAPSLSAHVWDAEMNTDFDFQRFYENTSTGHYVEETYINGAMGVGTNHYPSIISFVDNNASGGTHPGLFRTVILPTKTTDLHFTLGSMQVPQPAVVVTYGGVTCPSSVLADQTQSYVCANVGSGVFGNFVAPNSPLIGIPVVASFNGPAEMNPADWDVTAIAMSFPGGNPWVGSNLSTPAYVGHTVCGLPTGKIGFWYGGLEAYVPFMKSGNVPTTVGGNDINDTDVETWVKLSNRYAKPAKVYAVALNFRTESTVTTNNLLTTIPVNGQVVISGPSLVPIVSSDIAKSGASTNAKTELWNGTPIKFLIRAPGQYSFVPGNPLVNRFNRLGDEFTCDPYITGVVVQQIGKVNGVGIQRSMTLDFKSFKNGGLAVH